MRMLRTLGLLVFVVFVMAFASGCGGGGGGTTTTTEEPPVVTPEPEPTELSDAEKIATDIATVADILGDAQTAIQRTSSTASDIALSLDVTEGQLESAAIQNRQALDALNAIVASVTSVNAASTPAQSGAAVITARAAYARLVAAQSSLTALLDEIESPTTPTRPEQPQVAIGGTFTNGSSLIEFLQNNERASTAILSDLHGTNGLTRITVGPASATTPTAEDTASTCTAPCARFPYYKDPTVARPVSGVRNIEAQNESSNNNTGKLTGPSAFSFGFDLKDEDAAQPVRFVNAYTDIGKETRTGRGTTESPYEYTPDPDYLLLGVWLDVANQQIHAFAYGRQPVLVSSSMDFCDGTSDDRVSTTGTSRVCGDPTGNFHQINEFVPADEVINATYTGNANGAYVAGRNSSYFHASVEFKAEFKNRENAGTGWIEGKLSNFNVGGVSVAGNIDLIRHTFSGGTINGELSGIATGPVGGESYSGNWKGQFFGLKSGIRSSPLTSDEGATPKVYTTTYAPGAPGSVAGIFYATQQTEPNGETGFIGAFGAHNR